jgi:lipopolysaccharide transport system ATP-binding protein
MATTDLAVSVRGISKSYTIFHDVRRHTTLAETALARLRNPFARQTSESFCALKDVSFDIKKGEVVGIIGRNGAGKSTLLKIMSRITEPTTGKIDLYGRTGSLLEVGTGFHPELTGRENIFLNGAILGMAKERVLREFDAIIDFAGVEKFLDTPVKRYSSGMYVRLAFAVAAHLDPEILIVDEVLSVGDAQFQKKCLGKIGDVANKDGRTVILVSHHMGSIAQLCNKAILLDKGNAAIFGDTRVVIEHYLAQTTSDNPAGYSASGDCDKEMLIKRAWACDGADKRTVEFGHDDSISLHLICRISTAIPDAHIGIFVRDTRDRIVFRSEAAVPEGLNNAEVSTTIIIPNCTLVPGRYIVTLFIHQPHVRIIDCVEDGLVVNVTDTGSRFAHYDGRVDIGCVFVDCKWSMRIARQI